MIQLFHAYVCLSVLFSFLPQIQSGQEASHSVCHTMNQVSSQTLNFSKLAILIYSSCVANFLDQ